MAHFLSSKVYFRYMSAVIPLCIFMLAGGCTSSVGDEGQKDALAQQLSLAMHSAKDRLHGNMETALACVDQFEALAERAHDARSVLQARALRAEVLLHNRAPDFEEYMNELARFDVPGVPQAYAPWATYYQIRWQLGNRKWEAADSLLGSLFRGEQGPQDPELYLRCRIAQLKLLASRKEQAKADSLAETLRPALEMRGDPELLWRYKMAHALAHLNCTDPQGAELLYGEALTAAKQAENVYAEGLSLVGLANAQIDQGHSDKSAATANTADEAFIRAGDQRDRVEVLKLIGYCYWDNLGPEEVVKRWDLALHIADSLGMEREKAMTLLQVAKFRVSLDSSGSTTLGYDHASRFGTAMAMIDTAERIAKENMDTDLHTHVVKTRSTILSWQGKLDEAYAVSEEALRNYTDLGNRQMATASMIDLASMDITRKRWNSALRSLEKALPEAERGHYNTLRLLALNRLSHAHRNLGNFAKALEYKDDWTDLKDSLEGVEVTAKIAQTELRHSFAKRHYADSLAHVQTLSLEREVAMESVNRLRMRSIGLAGGGLLLAVGGTAAFMLDRRRRRERYAKQAAQLEVKALRAQMNPHFIFNALNSISAFIRGQEPDKAHAFIARFGKLMRIVLENSRKSEVSLASDLEALGIYMELEQARSGDKFDIKITVDPAIDQQETMVPPLVLQPFVENAVWHGMAGREGRGTVALDIRMRTGDLVVTISDDGIGMPKDRSAGTGRRSLGTVITKERLDQLAEQKGRPAGFRYLECLKGTCVEVVIPV